MATYRYIHLNGDGLILQKRFLWFFWLDFYPVENDKDLLIKKMNDCCEKIDDLDSDYKKLVTEQDSLCKSIKGRAGEPFRGPSWPRNRKMKKPIVGPQGNKYMDYVQHSMICGRRGIQIYTNEAHVKDGKESGITYDNLVQVIPEKNNRNNKNGGDNMTKQQRRQQHRENYFNKHGHYPE